MLSQRAGSPAGHTDDVQHKHLVERLASVLVVTLSQPRREKDGSLANYISDHAQLGSRPPDNPSNHETLISLRAGSGHVV